MGFECEILTDSVAKTAPHRLTTFRVKLPAVVQPQILRHRMFSFSVASTRAIPLNKQIEAVEDDPFVPISWGRAKSGMQAGEELLGSELKDAQYLWCLAYIDALNVADDLDRVGLHKQTAARLLMPFAWVDMVITGVWPAFANFFALRCHEAAQPEIRRIAVMMACAYRDGHPIRLAPGEWHLPFLVESERKLLDAARQTGTHHPLESLLIKSSVARCARVSYARHGVQGSSDPEADRDLHDRLLADLHVSPMEHQARAPHRAEDIAGLQGNLPGWVQYRQTLSPNVHAEFDFSTIDRFPEDCAAAHRAGSMVVPNGEDFP